MARRDFMSTFQYLKKISRPKQCLLAGITAWVVALLSNGPTWFTSVKLAAGAVISLQVLAASIWHYGARADVYARKHWDPVYVKRPWLLKIIGASLFLFSIVLSITFLPVECTAVAILNAIIILFYARLLDQYWPWKNLSIAGVCVTPLILGWFSGHRLNPVVPPLIAATFCIYLCREIFKDVVDLKANQGKRFTMVMQVGIPTANRIGGIILAVAIVFVIYSLKFAPFSFPVWALTISGAAWLTWFALESLLGKNVALRFSWMDLGTATILLSLLGTRFSMY